MFMPGSMRVRSEVGFPRSVDSFVRARLLALKRRWLLLTKGVFNPYPRPPNGVILEPSHNTASCAVSARMELDWSATKSGRAQGEWERKARKKLCELLRAPEDPAKAHVFAQADMPVAPGYTRQRVYLRFASERDAPVDLVRREGAGEGAATPVVICMQGTNSGAHLNLAEVRMPADVYKVEAGSALALQAADNGFIAVSFERACFGERRERLKGHSPSSPTLDAALHSLVLGETLLGQSVSELEALRQWIGAEVAPGAPVYMAGYSAAGTAAIAAAAAYPHFSGIAVGGCVGMMRDTVLKRGVSGYNDIPDMLQWFEFDALMALIAPRPCLVIAGKNDHIWPHAAGEKVMSSARRAWDQLGAAEKVELIAAPGGHTYYPELMWPGFARLIGGT